MALKKLMVIVGADLSEFAAGMKRMDKDLRAVEKQFAGFEKIGKRMAGVGKTLTAGLTLPIVGLGLATGVAANQIDEAMNTIRAGTGATGKDLERLGDSFRAVFKQVPQSADQVANAVASLNTRLGLTGSQLESMAIQMLNLARITKSDVAPIITSATRVFGDWAIATEDQAAALDHLYKVSQQTGIAIATLGEKMVYYGAPLRQMGFDFQTAAALVGKFEKEGVNLELVLGSLRIALTKMAKAGIEDPAEALKILIQRIKDAGSAGDANRLALEMFGARAGPDMAAAIREGRFELDGLLKNLRDSHDTINQAAYDTLSFTDSINILKNQMTLALEPIGRALLRVFDSLKPHLEKTIALVANLADRFAALDPKTQGVILTVVGLVATIGPLLMGIGKLIAFVPKLVAGFNLLKISLATSGTAFLATAATVGALLIAFGFLATQVKKLWDLEWASFGLELEIIHWKRLFQEFLGWIHKTFVDFAERNKWLKFIFPGIDVLVKASTRALDDIGQEIDKLNKREAWIVNTINEIERMKKTQKKEQPKDPFADMTAELSKQYSELQKRFAELFKQFSGVSTSVTETADRLEEWKAPTLEFVNTLDKAVDAMKEIKAAMKDVSEFFDERSPAEKLRDRLMDALAALQEMRGATITRLEGMGLGGAMPGVGMAATGIGKELFDALGELDAAIVLTTEQLALLDEVIEKANEKIDTLGEYLSDLGKRLWDDVIKSMPILSDTLQEAARGFKAGGIWGAIAGAFMSLVKNSAVFARLLEIANALLQVFADMVGALLEPLLPLIQVISSTLTPILKALAMIISSILLPVMQLLFPVFKLLGMVMIGVAIAISAAWNAIAKAINKILGWLGVNLKLIDITGLQEAFAELRDMTWDNAMAQGEAAEAARDMAESLTNVPQAFKVALARFAAIDVPSFDSGGYMPYTGLARLHAGERVLTPEQQRGGGGDTFHLHLEGSTFYGMDDFEQKVAGAMDKVQRTRAARRGGNSSAASGSYAFAT